MKSPVVRKLIFPLARIYWRVFRPETFGVKGVVLRGSDRAALFVRHTYGNTDIWNLPGGGYKPRKESPAQAIAREIKEELGLNIECPIELGEYRTQAQGKQDTVTIFQASCEERGFKLSHEIAEARWISRDQALAMPDLYPIAHHALKLHLDHSAQTCAPS